jgi:hypothetical protein
MSPRSSSISRAALGTLTWMALLGAAAGCGDESKSDPDPASEEATQSGSATDKPAKPAAEQPAAEKGADDGKAKAAPAGPPGAGLERPGTLARPPSDGTLPAELRPPR